MFKCKVTDTEFVDNSIDLAKGKNLVKSGVKKLKNAPETKTPFYVSLDYYKDGNDKPLGHFFALGDSPKMKKQFETKELKGKGVNSDAKASACGSAYVKAGENGPVLCLEPHAKVKMTKAKWSAFAKHGSIKSTLGGMKIQVVTADGKVESTEESPETPQEETSEQTESTTTSPNKDKRMGQLETMQKNMDTMNNLSPDKQKANSEKLQGNIDKYETALKKLIDDAKSDGVIDQEEQDAIDKLTAALEELKAAISGGSDTSGKKITPERRKKINENIDVLSGRLDQIMKSLGL